MLSLVFFVSAFDVISSISAVNMFANLCLFIFLLGSVSLVVNLFRNFTFNHRVICTFYLVCAQDGLCPLTLRARFRFLGYKRRQDRKTIIMINK